MKYKSSCIFSKLKNSKRNTIFNQFFNDRDLTAENIERYNKISHRADYPFPHLDENNTRYTRYIILGTERTGSSYLVELLKSHPSVISFSELFMDNCSSFNYLGYPHHADIKLINYRNDHPVEFLENLVYKPYKKNIAAVGFKLFYSQAHNNKLETVWDYLNGLNDLKIIHIQRSNTFHSFVSSKIALKEGASKYPGWVIKEIQQLNMGIFMQQPGNYEKTLIEIDYQECLNYFEKVKAEKAYYSKYFINHFVLDLYYEDLLVNVDRECEKLCRFLHLSNVPLKTFAEKQINVPIKEIVKNYNELKNSFEGSEWYLFFDE
jgi:hypothetical protein